jgi:hypothetical protein
LVGTATFAEARSGRTTSELLIMCDYSLQTVRSRPAKLGDQLTTRDFGTGTRGFAAHEDRMLAVCVLPGTELVFANEVTITIPGFLWMKKRTIGHTTAVFRQINKNDLHRHHDALEFPDGSILLLTQLCGGQRATVLQLPAQPTTPAEVKAQRRVEYVG